MKLLLGGDAIRYPLTGIGRYAWELASGLVERDEIQEIKYFIGSSVCSDLPDPHLYDLDIQVVSLTRSVKMMLLKSNTVVGFYRRLNTLQQGRALKPFSEYVYHGPNYYLPPHDGPCVSTFHDLSIFLHPEFHPSSRVRYMAHELPVALQRADVLITVSEYMRQEVIAYSGFSPSRVLAIPLAASADFRPRRETECREFLQRSGLTYGSFILFAGTIEPRKNIAGLLDAYERLPRLLRQQYPLVLAGYKGWKSEALHQRLARAQAAGWLKYLGFVTEQDLPVLFSAARAFAFPSNYEGFGLPVLEAMSSGVPVVCSNVSSLPEVSGGCALTCAPQDIDALSSLLVRVLEDERWRGEAIARGIAHAAKFSWLRVVNETLWAYRLAASL